MFESLCFSHTLVDTPMLLASRLWRLQRQLTAVFISERSVGTHVIAGRPVSLWSTLVIGSMLLFGGWDLQASPVVYSFVFSAEGSSALPTAGSFSYDAAAPEGVQFADFDIAWDGINFDLTSSANSARFGSNITSSCFPALDSAGLFNALQNPSDCNSYWVVEYFGTTADFAFVLQDKTFSNSSAVYDLEPSTRTAIEASGSWVVTTSTLEIATPEPAALCMMMLGLVGMIGTRCIRKRK